jgi:20S proteasome alpha/beta subunit
MTICIAALCNKGQSVVVAADRMVSAPFLTIEFDHPNAKIDIISPRCVALSAGDVLAVTDVLSESSGISGQLQDPTVRLITDEIKQRFVQVRHRLLHERLFQPRGLSFDEYYRRGLIQSIPPDLAMMLDNQVQSFLLGASLIVAGVDSSGGHIYSVEDPGTSQCFDRLGYHAIGSGHRHAILSLVTLQHNVMVDLERAIYNVYCAKRQAEIAPGVGLATDMSIIEREGTIVIDNETLEKLGKVFTERTSPPPNLERMRSHTESLSHGATDDGEPESAEQSQ